MKNSLYILFFLLLTAGNAASAQEKDSTRLPVDFSTKPFVDWSPASKDFAKSLVSTVVIIDRKIYTLQSKEWLYINKKEISSMSIVKDEKSLSPIKCVITITTKKKPLSNN
jgi:hypothetical protein